MPEEPENLILQYLRRFEGRLTTIQEDLHDIKIRTTNLEEGMAAVNRRLDRMDDRLMRIEHCLEIVDA